LEVSGEEGVVDGVWRGEASPEALSLTSIMSREKRKERLEGFWAPAGSAMEKHIISLED
jgi:hypothetical protein